MRTGRIYGLYDPTDDSLGGKPNIRYVGQSVHPKIRYKGHLKSRGGRNKVGSWIVSLRRKGIRPKMLYLTDPIPENELDAEEIATIKRLRESGYKLLNMTPGGSAFGSGEDHPWYGRKHTKESRMKMSKAHKGKKLSKEAKRNIRLAKLGPKNPLYGLYGENHPSYGRKHDEETRRKMRENHADFTGEKHPMYGRKQSEEAKRKMQAAIRVAVSCVECHRLFKHLGAFSNHVRYKHPGEYDEIN